MFAREVERGRNRGSFLLAAWVLMPEHVHLLLMPPPPESSLVGALWTLKRNVAKTGIAWLRSNDPALLASLVGAEDRPKFWQPGGGHDRVMRSSEEVREKIKYMHENPVRRGLVGQPVDWVWSSARWYAGSRDETVCIDPISL